MIEMHQAAMKQYQPDNIKYVQIYKGCSIWDPEGKAEWKKNRQPLPDIFSHSAPPDLNWNIPKTIFSLWYDISLGIIPWETIYSLRIGLIAGWGN